MYGKNKNKPLKTIIKKIFSLLIVLLLSIDSFAAVVSDNDGSAFITKAEFDSLKNTFQAQIDQYNTSIDSKIDGAIAAYLAGIRLAKKEKRNCDGYEKNGVLSLNSSDDAIVKWYEGWLDFNIAYGWVGGYSTNGTRWLGGNTGVFGMFAKITTRNKSNQAFKEKVLFNADYSKTDVYNGEWRGYSLTKQELFGFSNGGQTVNGWTYLPSTMSSGYRITFEMGVNPWASYSNTDLNSSDAKRSLMFMHLYAGSITMTSGSNPCHYDTGTSLFSRNILGTLFSDAQILSKNTKLFRLTNGEKVLDFMNDEYLKTDHKGYTSSKTPPKGSYDFGDLFDQKISYGCSDSQDTALKEWRLDHTGELVTSVGREKSIAPYLGFVNKGKELYGRQIWTSRYDSIFERIEKAVKSEDISKWSINNSCSYKSLNTEERNQKHLLLLAGTPICEVKEGEIIEMELSATDYNNPQYTYNSTSRTYSWNPLVEKTTLDNDLLLWFRLGPFLNDKDPWEDTSERIVKSDTIKVDGEEKLGTLDNSIVLSKDKKTHKIQFTAKKSGYLFVKFAKDSSSLRQTGGGVLKLPETVTITQAD